MTKAHRTHIVGSERQPLPGASASGPVPPHERIEVTVQLRPRTPPPALKAMAAQLPAERSYASREAYAASHGASSDDIAAVTAFASAHGLAVVATDAARRSVTLSGTAEALIAAFDVELANYAHDGGTYRGRTGSISVPAELGGIVVGVFGLDDRPQAAPHFQRLRPPAEAPGGAAVQRAAQVSVAYTPLQLAQLYDFPSGDGADGHGQCIAIIELGGGYRPADIKTYFTALGLPVPKVTAVRIDGGKNQPTTADSADGEVMLDIEVAAAVAPKASIVVYFAPNTNQGFLDAITTAIHDTVHKPSVVSISWGSAEANWTGQGMTSSTRRSPMPRRSASPCAAPRATTARPTA